jgi:hypothetical protein
MDSKEDIMISMEPTTTAQNIQRLNDRFKVLSEQFITGRLTWSQYQRMLAGAFAEINGDS